MEFMKYATDELLLDIEDYLLERYEAPESHILFQAEQINIKTGFDTL